MSDKAKTAWKKYGWVIYISLILLFVLGNYVEYKNIQSGHVEIEHITEEDIFTEEITPIANLVCVECHSSLEDGTLTIPASVWYTSDEIHKDVGIYCSDCHGGDLSVQVTNEEWFTNSSHKDYDINCVNCHEEGVNFTTPGIEWYTSIHMEVGTTCADCHGGDPTNIEGAMIGNFIGKPDRNNVSKMCGNCHPDVFSEYKESIHYSFVYDEEAGETVRASVCTDCHGIHHIESSNNPESPTYVMNNPDTCAKCHDALYYSYEDSYHGIFLKYGNLYVAACADCHSNHNVRPAMDSESTTNPANLPLTCAGENDECHPNNLRVKVAEGYQHFDEHDSNPNLMFDKSDMDPKEQAYYIGPIDIRYWVPLFFNIITMVLVPAIVVLMILENTGKPIGRRFQKWMKKEKE